LAGAFCKKEAAENRSDGATPVMIVPP